MSWRSILSALIVIFLGTQSFADRDFDQIKRDLLDRFFMGHEVGNGGDVQYCESPGGKIERVEFYDITEARILRGIEPNWGSDSLEYQEKVRIALDRLERYAPLLAEQYRIDVEEFFERAIITDHRIAGISDSFHDLIERGCELGQAVKRTVPIGPEDPLYVVDQLYWGEDFFTNPEPGRMDHSSRAALVLHEVIYGDAIDRFGHRGSRRSRYFSSYLFSGKILSLGAREWIAHLKNIEFDTADFGGLWFSTDVQFAFYPDNTLAKITAKVSDLIPNCESDNDRELRSPYWNQVIRLPFDRRVCSRVLEFKFYPGWPTRISRIEGLRGASFYLQNRNIKVRPNQSVIISYAGNVNVLF